MTRFFSSAFLQLAVVRMFPFFMIANAQIANDNVIAGRLPAPVAAGYQPVRSVLPINRHAVLSTSNRVGTDQQ